MKKLIIIFAFILVISISIIIMQTIRPGESAALMIQEAFAATGAEIVSSEIYIRCTLTDGSFESEEQQKRLMKELIDGAGGDTAGAAPDFTEIDTDISYGTETDYIINNNSSINISVLKYTQDNETDRYRLTVSLADTSRKPEISKLTAGLTGILLKHCAHPEVNISITGSLDGNLKDYEIEALCGEVFRRIHADRVEGMVDNGLTSITAFSRSIKDAVRVNGRRVNINMAARYNSYEGKTYIWLASPVITTEY